MGILTRNGFISKYSHRSQKYHNSKMVMKMIMLFEYSNDPLKLDLNSPEMKLFNAWCSRKGHTYFKNLQLSAAGLLKYIRTFCGQQALKG